MSSPQFTINFDVIIQQIFPINNLPKFLFGFFIIIQNSNSLTRIKSLIWSPSKFSSFKLSLYLNKSIFEQISLCKERLAGDTTVVDLSILYTQKFSQFTVKMISWKTFFIVWTYISIWPFVSGWYSFEYIYWIPLHLRKSQTPVIWMLDHYSSLVLLANDNGQNDCAG